MLSFADGRTFEVSEHEAEAAKEMLSYASNRLYAQKVTGENRNNILDAKETWNPLINPATTIYQKLVKIFLGLMVILFMMSYQIKHPVFTAGINQDWIYSDDGTAQFWPVDNYYPPGERHTNFLDYDVVKQHHTLTQILMGLLHNGFTLQAVEEAMPSPDMLDIPGMKDELRRPMMLLVKAQKR